MLISRISGIACKSVILFGILLFCTSPVHAQKKKKYKNKSDANILARGYNDVTTRNNYYFNAQLIYKDIPLVQKVLPIEYPSRGLSPKVMPSRRRR